jgi:IS30 family transposase
MMPDFEPVLTITKIAKLASCSPETIYNLIYSGKLRAVQLNPDPKAERKNWRVSLSAWNDFLAGGKIKK